MRIWMIGCAFTVLAACDAPARLEPVPVGDVPSPRTTPAAPFAAPMNPAALPCSAVTASPAALAFATDWITGQLRAATLNGQFPGPVPADAETARALGQFCTENPRTVLQSAVPALSAG